MIQHADDLHGFRIAVSIEAPKPQNVSRFERVVMRLGPPDAVVRACNRIMVAMCVATFAYIAAWAFWIEAAVTKTINPTVGQTLVMALAWTPLMACQLFLGAVRYGVAGLHVKAAELAAKAVSTEFFEAINATVAKGVERAMQERDEPQEKPTLQ